MGNFEPEANDTSESESYIMVVLESSTTKKEQISTPLEETKEVKYVEKEIQEEVEGQGGKISPELPEISLQEAQHDQKSAEKSYFCLEVSQHPAAVETILGGMESIDKDKQTEDVVSAASEAPEYIPHEEDEDQITPFEAVKLKPAEKDSETEYAEFPPTIEKNSELTLETETTTDPVSQKSEITEQVELETQSEEKSLGSKEVENRSLTSEEEKVEASKECQNACGADDIFQNEDVPSEKAETSYGESNAAILTMEATEIYSAGAEQDVPIKESANESLAGSLELEVKTTRSEGIQMNVIKRDGILDEEVHQQKSSVNFIHGHISTCAFIH